jgi:hypothetical protein
MMWNLKWWECTVLWPNRINVNFNHLLVIIFLEHGHGYAFSITRSSFLQNPKDPHSSPNSAITFYKSSNLKLFIVWKMCMMVTHWHSFIWQAHSHNIPRYAETSFLWETELSSTFKLQSCIIVWMCFDNSFVCEIILTLDASISTYTSVINHTLVYLSILMFRSTRKTGLI